MALQTIRDGYIDTLRKNYDQQLEWRRNRIRQSSNDARQRSASKPAVASGKFLWYVVAGLIAGIPLYLIAWFLRLKSSDMLIAG